jgi:hypothetical protein
MARRELPSGDAIRGKVMPRGPITDALVAAARDVTPTDRCSTCGHPWQRHSTAAGADWARRRGLDPVPCIELVPAKPRGICGCNAIAPAPVTRPTAGHL